jgi:hypothetical protein
MRPFDDSPAQPAQSPELSGSQPVPSFGLAVASMVLGILSFFTFGLTAIPAVICGHISYSKIKKATGRTSGNGFAKVGLVTGYFSLLFIAAFVLGVAPTIFTEVQDRKQAEKCLNEGHQIAVACQRYATNHQGNFPPTLDQLVPEYLPDKHIFECQLRKNQPPTGYNYFGGKNTDSPYKILLSSKATTRTDRSIVITCDGECTIDNISFFIAREKAAR